MADTVLSHEDVLDRLEEALLGPGHLAAIEHDGSERGRAVRDHLRTCATCRAEHAALSRTASLLAAAAPDPGDPSPAVRGRVLAAAASTGRPRGAGAPAHQRGAVRRRLPSVPALAGLAAAAVVLLFAGGVLLGPLLSGIGAGPPPTRGLAAVAASLDRVVADPGATQTALRDADGDRAGMAAYGPAANELVVISTALEPREGEGAYRCYVERGDDRMEVGKMYFEGSTAFWAGPLWEPVDRVLPGDRFVVILDGAGDDPILTGQF